MDIETILKMCIALGVVLLTFGATVYLFRKFGSRFGLGIKDKKGRRSQNEVEIQSFQNLGPGRAIYVLRVDARRLLVGATQNSINLISDLGEDLDAISEEEGFSESLSDRVGQEARSKFSKSYMGMPRV